MFCNFACIRCNRLITYLMFTPKVPCTHVVHQTAKQPPSLIKIFHPSIQIREILWFGSIEAWIVSINMDISESFLFSRSRFCWVSPSSACLWLLDVYYCLVRQFIKFLKMAQFDLGQEPLWEIWKMLCLPLIWIFFQVLQNFINDWNLINERFAGASGSADNRMVCVQEWTWVFRLMTV